MGRTPDRSPGPSYEEGIYFEDHGGDPSTIGEIRRNGGALKAFDSGGVFDLRSGTGLSASAHKALKDLIHFLDDGPADGWASGAYREVTGSPWPSAIVWWTSAAKTHKIVSLDITRNANKTPSVEVWKGYDTDGSTVLVTLTDTISYSGVSETSRTRTWT